MEENKEMMNAEEVKDEAQTPVEQPKKKGLLTGVKNGVNKVLNLRVKDILGAAVIVTAAVVGTVWVVGTVMAKKEDGDVVDVNVEPVGETVNNDICGDGQI